MAVWAGIDLGTSGVKVALFDADDTQHAVAARVIDVSRPFPGWSEQHPDIWWDAVVACLDELAAHRKDLLAAMRGIGLSGQMLGPVLLDRDLLPLRPAILWNDQRALAECDTLLARVPDIGLRTNGAPDPGLVAPKLLWLAEHEPAILDATRLLLLPKDYVRLRLTGEVATEPTDGGGTMLMDCATGRWDAALCDAAGWSTDRLPEVRTTWEAAGMLRDDLAARWGAPAGIAVAAGAGDNMACTIGVGAARPGDVAISIGTSAVVNAVDEVFHPVPDKAVLTSAHAAPDVFLSMGVVMSATASLDWLARLTGVAAAGLAAEAERFAAAGDIGTAPVMRPSLSGLRTPHNRPDASGAIDGLRQTSDRAALAYALLEGVAFQIAECAQAQRSAGVTFSDIRLVGGGARSALWPRLIATMLDSELTVPEGAALSANIGAARLSRIASGDAATDCLSRSLPTANAVSPDGDLRQCLADRFVAYQALPVSSMF